MQSMRRIWCIFILVDLTGGRARVHKLFRFSTCTTEFYVYTLECINFVVTLLFRIPQLSFVQVATKLKLIANSPT